VTSGAKTTESCSANPVASDRDAATRALQDLGSDPLAQIIGAVDLHFWLMNADPPELVYASPATLKAWGPTVSGAELRVPRVHPDDLLAYAELFSAVSGIPQEAEYRVIADDGTQRWRRSRVFPIRDAAGNVSRIAGVTEDITVRKEAEREIAVRRAIERLITTISANLVNLSAPRMEEAFCSALADLASVIGAEYAGIALVEGSDATLRVRWQWSRSGELPAFPQNLSAALASEFRATSGGYGLFNLRSVSSLPSQFAESAALLMQSGIRSVVDAPLKRGDEIIGFLGFASSDEGKNWPSGLAQLVEIAADMFANAIGRIRSESAMRDHLDQLAHVLRLGTMGQLASGMAHELNQPLAAIMNYVLACERGIDAGRIDAASLRTAVRAIGAQAARAADVIKALRALVKAESRREYEDIDQLVTEALRLLESEASQKGIQVSFEGLHHGVRVHVDGIQIQQVLLNLLGNAFDAIQASGSSRCAVYVSTRAISPDIVEVSVRDTGPGVDAEKANIIFEDFYTSKPQGLGLGLSISRSLVEAHGGHLRLDRGQTEGACFRFTLPVSSR
jgi:PAS domain S-box-containing protein